MYPAKRCLVRAPRLVSTPTPGGPSGRLAQGPKVAPSSGPLSDAAGPSGGEPYPEALDRAYAERAPRVAVLGLGNTLLGDDGVGPEVAQRLQRDFSFPTDTAVVDLGTPGLDLTPYLLDVESVLFVDAVDFDAQPGTVRMLSREEVLATTLSPRVSPHDPGVQHALQIVELVQERRLDVSVLGVKPSDVTLGRSLSPAVIAALPSLTSAVLDWLGERGVHPVASSADAEVS